MPKFYFASISRRIIFPITLIVMISVLAYGQTIDRFFTGSDALALIYSAQINSASDFLRVLSSPLMDGTAATEVSLYYRPVSALSYSYDYAIWKLTPVGYHLTNLILHIAASIALFFLLHRTNGKQNEVSSWIGITLFLLHPILLETVPTIANRQDVLATLFIAISLLFVHRLLFEAKLSIFEAGLLAICSLLAIGAKELGIVLLPLAFAYIIYYRMTSLSGYSNKKAVTVILAVSLPIVIFILVRFYVLDGLGGFEKSLTMGTVLLINEQFWKGLIYPLQLPFLSKPYELILYGAALVVVMLQTRGLVYKHNKKSTQINYILLFINFWVFFGTLVFEFISDEFLLSVVGKAINKTLSYPSTTLTIIHRMSPRFQSFALSALAITAVTSTIIRSRLISSERKALYALYGIWLALPLTIYLLTTPAGAMYRLLYFPLVAYCMLLALFIQDFYQFLSQNGFQLLNKYQRWAFMLSGTILMSTVGIHVISSPLFHRYDDLYTSTAVIENILQEISKVADNAPPNSHISLHSLPLCILSERQKTFTTVSTPYLAPFGHTVQSWLDLNYPAKHLTVSIEKGVAWSTFISPITGVVSSFNDKEVFVRFDAPHVEYLAEKCWN